MEVAFVLGSVTCLKAFLKPFEAGYLITQSDTAPTSGYGSRVKGSKSNNAYYMLSGAREKKENLSSAISSTTQRSWTDEPHELAPVPQALIAPGTESQRTRTRPPTRSHSTDSRAQMIISQTNTWTVEYEYDDDDEESKGTAGRAM